MGSHKGVSQLPRNLALRREKAKLVSQLRLRGVTNQDVGAFMGITARQVQNITNWAADNGIIEDTRKQMQAKLLPKLEKVYLDIMDTPVGDIDKDSKGYGVKLAAAKQLGDGFGVFRKTPVTTVTEQHTVDLQGYMALAAAKDEPSVKDVVSEIIDGETPDALSPGEDPEGAIDALGTETPTTDHE